MKRLLLAAVMVAIAGCSGEPAICLHVEATPSDDPVLREMTRRIGEEVSARVRDFSDDEPTEGNVSDVFVELDGPMADAVLAHQSMHPWICLYGDHGSTELSKLQGLFESRLTEAGFKYRLEERQPKGKATSRQ